MSRSTTTTPAEQQARAILLKLPVEIVFHFWGVVLRQSSHSYDDFNTILHCVPELAWSVEIITDDVMRFSSVYGCAVLSLSEHENETRSLPHMGKLIRRVAILSACDRAVRLGELSAYEGCRYARLLRSPRVDASFCLLLPQQNKTKGYTEELIDKHRQPSSATVHIIEAPEVVPCDLAIENGQGPPGETSTGFRSKFTGRLADYRVVLAKACLMRENGGASVLRCSTPIIWLTYDQLAPQVRIAFKGSRIPIAAYTAPGSFNDQVRTIDLRLEEFRIFENSVFSIANLNWSLDMPGGIRPCRHMSNGASFERYPGRLQYPMLFTYIYKRVWYYGVSDMTMVMSCEELLEEVVWFRLSPYYFRLHRRSQGHSMRGLESLKRLAIFSELTKEHGDRTSMPMFRLFGSVECVQLVALNKSDEAWNLHLLLGIDDLQSLGSLELLQLRASDANPPSQENLTIDWLNINSIAPIVQELTIGGYIPGFALPEYATLSSTNAIVFSHLRLLCLDVSALAFKEDPCYKLCLPETLYPSLTHLYLKGDLAVSMELPSYPSVTLSKTCTVLGLSSVIRTKAEVNGKLLKAPDIPLIAMADVFNWWLLSRETGDYVYAGAGHETVTRRIEEVDEKLRPI